MRNPIPFVVIIVLTACGSEGPPPQDSMLAETRDFGPIVPGDVATTDVPAGDSGGSTDATTVTPTPSDAAVAVDTAPHTDTNTTTPPAPDATEPADVAEGPDSEPVADTSSEPDTSGPTPVEECANQGFLALSAGYNDFGDLQILEAYDADLPPFGVLGLEIYDSAMRGPGSRDILPQNYRDCKLCVRIRTGCGAAGCANFWLAESGRVVIDSWDTHITGYLDDVVLSKVTIDPDTNVSTQIDGPGWCISRFYFNIQAD